MTKGRRSSTKLERGALREPPTPVAAVTRVAGAWQQAERITERTGGHVAAAGSRTRLASWRQELKR
jgi:hypothetical protein